MDLSSGGIADYADAQATALAARGVGVQMLCTPDFLKDRRVSYRATPCLNDWRAAGAGRMANIRRARDLVGNFHKLADHVSDDPQAAVLMHFSEYLAPFWAPRLRHLRRRGTIFASVLHDPVRDHQVGPKWWHKRSVREAFSFLDMTLVHTRDPIVSGCDATVRWIPHGLFDFPDPTNSRGEVRRMLKVPDEAMLAVSYGYLRDNKNLDLAIEAVSRTSNVYLLVAGREQSSRNKSLSYYQQLGDRLGCGDRLRWLNSYISQEQTADLLSASDVMLLSYSSSFVSWSGVLTLAARYRLPAIVSGGTNTMASLVNQFRTGLAVEPDSAEAIQQALANWLEPDEARDWDGYQAEMSWDRNAELIETYITELRAQK